MHAITASTKGSFSVGSKSVTICIMASALCVNGWLLANFAEQTVWLSELKLISFFNIVVITFAVLVIALKIQAGIDNTRRLLGGLLIMLFAMIFQFWNIIVDESIKNNPEFIQTHATFAENLFLYSSIFCGVMLLITFLIPSVQKPANHQS